MSQELIDRMEADYNADEADQLAQWEEEMGLIRTVEENAARAAQADALRVLGLGFALDTTDAPALDASGAGADCATCPLRGLCGRH